MPYRLPLKTEEQKQAKSRPRIKPDWTNPEARF